MTLTLRKCAMATAVLGALAAGDASAALRLSDALEGNWFDPAADGRGVQFEIAPHPDGDGSHLAVTLLFTYDAAGKPLWLIAAPRISEFGYTGTADLIKVEGGNFGSPIPPGSLTNEVVGQMTLTFNSCTSATMDLQMTPASGLQSFTWNLVPVTGVGQPSCVYQRKFEGCPSFATPAPAYGDRACMISGSFLGQDITLTNEITWVIDQKVNIGGDNAQQSILRIEPGTLLVSSGDSFDHIAVNRGSKIYAEGRQYAPIILTSPKELPGFDGEPAPQDVGGLVISGNAPANCNPNCVAEWDNTNRYGGSDPMDNSGIIRYMQVRYAGYVFAPNRELNSFTLNAVGAGTTLEYLQSYKGADDGIEFFGGTANVRYFVDVCGGDDSIDWDEGYSGKMQFALVVQQGCAGEDHGFEVSNSPTNFDATPRSRPTIANFTLIGGGAGSASSRDGFNIKEGSGGNWYNGIVTNFKRACISIEGAATQAAAGPANALTGVLTINNTIIHCANNYREGTGVTAGYAQAWFTGQAGNVAGDPQLSGFLPTGTVHLNKHFKPTSDWFMPTDYAGAFRSNRREDNWTLGWTKGVN
ncbi:MAG: hypothetical protein ACK4RW_11745 [Rehaibacterium terrae]|uniref:hypothetical protein n=1 Tax=Rehaibacterium terrae TaxID=1341696 RepID=UPI00391D60B3